ncbi:MAG: flagellar biosynthetic protein FliO [Balneolaceae bacterium]
MDWEKLKQQIKSEPRKTLRFVIGLSITLMVLWVMVLMQSETGSGTGYVKLNEIELSTTGQEIENSQTQPSIFPANLTDEENSSSSGILFLWVTIGVGALLYGYVVRKKSKMNRRPDPEAYNKLSLLESIELPSDQTVSIVKVCNEFWIVGSGNQGINLLKILDREEWNKLGVNLQPDSSKEPFKNGFMSLLDSVRKHEISSVNGSESGT